MEVESSKIYQIKEPKDKCFLENEDVKYIIEKYSKTNVFKIKRYSLQKASDKMLGFLAEYWKLEVDVAIQEESKRFNFFIKSVARSNAGKAAMVKEMKLFEKEMAFYTIIKPKIEISGSRLWSAKLAAVLKNDLVLEDLTALNYRSRNKFEQLDIEHCKQALETIATFHSRTIIFEEKKRCEGFQSYTVCIDFQNFLNKGGYVGSSPWFIQCMNGALEALEEYSKYGRTHGDFEKIEREWRDVWLSGLELSDCCSTARNVICHRDLWNNNLLYHYDSSGSPDGCALVDFQAIRSQPPAGDVMLFLYCSNVDSQTREENLQMLLEHYHACLANILEAFDIAIEGVLPLEEFCKSAEEQRKWGLIVSACLLPQIWIDDDRVTEIFSDSERFNTILNKEKGSFIKSMIVENKEYKEKILERFEEIVLRFIL